MKTAMLQMQAGCSECERLWAEYEDTTRLFFRLQNKLAIAKSMQADDAPGALVEVTDQAAALRIARRRQILEHTIAAHGIADSAKA